MVTIDPGVKNILNIAALQLEGRAQILEKNIQELQEKLSKTKQLYAEIKAEQWEIENAIDKLSK